MMFLRTILPGLIFFAALAEAQASPYCVELTGIPLQCLYVDPGSCQHEADRLGGLCTANPAEFTTPVGGAAYCVVESGNVATCAYGDRRTCTTDSHQRNGACIAATPAKPPAATDPFEVKRPY